MYFAAGPFEHAVTNRSLGASTEGKEMMVGYGSYDAMVDVLERAVSARPYIAGDRFTAADVYVGNQVMWGVRFGTLPTRAAFTDYAGRLGEREAHKRATALDDAAMPPAA